MLDSPEANTGRAWPASAASRTRACPRAVYLAGAEQPLLLEGEAGEGKTEKLAKALAAALGGAAVRLQCHEGIDLLPSPYDWDYPRQLPT